MIRSEILKGHSEKQAIRPNKYILVQNTFNAFPCLLTLPFKDTLVYHLARCIFLLPLQVSLSKLHSKGNKTGTDLTQNFRTDATVMVRLV